MEEERQARARTPQPRVPVVSRPTAARTNYMVEMVRVLSTSSGAPGGSLENTRR